MNRGKHLTRGVCFVLLMTMTALALCTPAMGGSAEAGPADRRVPYVFFIDDLNGQGNASGDERPYIAKDWTLAQGQKITFSGWLATAEGVTKYQYAFVPQDSAFPDWQDAENPVIVPRPDLAPAGIPHQTGHDTAGFTITVTAPKGVDGFYDFYLRGVSGDDVFCDMLIVINVAVGFPDRDDTKTHTVNLARLSCNPETLSGGTFEGDGAIRLGGQGTLALGSFDLGLFESVTIKYTASDTFTAGQNGDRAILGLKSAPDGSRTGQRPGPYRMDDGKYDMTDSIVYGTLAPGGGSLQMDLTECDACGELYLSTYAFGNDEIRISDVTFTYINAGASRAAVKIHYSAALSDYFYSPNAAGIETVHDNNLGDVMRISALQDTNDAYIHFGFESLLATKDFRLSADDYKFIVVLYRTKPNLPGHNMTFYLCPGAIGGPTEACTKSATLNNDGKWHYIILDLRDRDTWQGIIHLWRFDMIQGNASAGDYVDYATVQFFRTEEAANKAAAADPNKPDKPFTAGDDPIELDMSEEEALSAGQVDFVPAADRTYIFSEPATEVPTEADTLPPDPETAPGAETRPADTPAADTVPAEEPTEAETGGAGGCRSSLPLVILPLLMFLPFLRVRRNKYSA